MLRFTPAGELGRRVPEGGEKSKSLLVDNQVALLTLAELAKTRAVQSEDKWIRSPWFRMDHVSPAGTENELCYQSSHRSGQSKMTGTRLGCSSKEQEQLAAESQVQPLSGLF